MKKYLSYSQLSLWNKSKREYIKRYFENIPMFETKELIFGKEFSKMLENREIETDYLDNSEFKLEYTLNEVPLLGYLDSSSEDLSEIIEYKTGKTEWTQERVNNHKQLWIYATIIKNITGKAPKTTLIWHETIDNTDGTIVLTGRVEKFNFVLTDEIEKSITEEIKIVWQEIKEAYENRINRDINQDIYLEYAELTEQIKQLQDKQKELKEKLEVPNEGVKFDFGSFYYTERKSYSYSDDIKTKEQELKDLKKEFEKTATPKITKSLSFRG